MGCTGSKQKKRQAEPVQAVPAPVEVSIVQPSVPVSSITVRTQLRLEDVQSADFTPHNTTRQTLKYSCPICLKYFSAILITSCCRNYLCHFCTESFKEKEKLGPVHCPMCNSEGLDLEDVDPQAEVKRYSDSPFSTFGAGKSSNQGKWVSKLAIVEEDKKLAEELEEAESPLVDLNNLPSLHAHLAVTT